MSVTYPPTSGPAMEATPNTPLNIAWMRARSASVYSSPTIVMLSGMIAPAPSPWTARAAMSTAIEVAAPDEADPTRKMATPRR